MKLGRYTVPADCEDGLGALIEEERDHPYGPAGDVRLEERVVRALDGLAAHGLDLDGALRLFAQVDYWTEAEGRWAWQRVYRMLVSWCAGLSLDACTDAYWLQVRHENHVNDVFEANNLAGRTDPEVQPVMRSVEDLWDTVKLVRDGGQSSINVDALRSARRRPVWVLFWDVNLSGTTVAKELKRIALCARILRPGMPTDVHVASQVISAAARARLVDAYAELRLSGQVFAARALDDRRVARESGGYEAAAPAPEDLLCEKFFDSIHWRGGERWPPARRRYLWIPEWRALVRSTEQLPEQLAAALVVRTARGWCSRVRRALRAPSFDHVPPLTGTA